MVGFETSDDALVYQLDDERALIETVDFFPPVVDDPYAYGQIAAANALSDVYAMGGTPTIAMNLLCIPADLPDDIVLKIMQGGYDKVKEAGAIIAGGHTIEDDEPKYGLCVTGMIRPQDVLRNSTAKEGDALILTKPLGLGILSTANKADLLEKESYEQMIDVMSTLNGYAKDCMMKVGVHSCTDVTGFGLLGHGCEMAEGSGLTMEIDHTKLPILPGVIDWAEMGIIPSGAYTNFDFLEEKVRIEPNVKQAYVDIVSDPQTSGGLLIAVEPEKVEQLLDLLHEKTPWARCIGRMAAASDKSFVIK